MSIEINLNSTTPAPITGRTNVIWQNDNNSPENVSAYMDIATSSAAGALIIAGDLGGTALAPNVISTHLSNPLALTQGGTGANLSTTGGTSQVLQQSSSGAVVTVAQLQFTDIAGIIAVTAGGTGTATPNIVAGNNITISGSWPNQTIAVTNPVAAINLTGQTAAISSTLLYAVPSGGAGLYRISAHVIVSTAASAGSMNIELAWTNQSGGGAGTFLNQNSAIPIDSLNDSSTIVLDSQPITISAQASTNIYYSTEFIGVSGSPVYQLRIRVEYLG